MYGAPELPAKICSKSLFSSTTITTWSYTGRVEGQDNESAANATSLGAQIKSATAHRCEIFDICVSSADADFSVLLEARIGDAAFRR
jgi:hypothetical protein